MLNLLGKYRRHLKSYDALLAYSLLGVVGGIASAETVTS